MPISEWPDHHPPDAHWELTRLPLNGWSIDSETPVTEAPAAELAKALVALRTRLGLETNHPDEVLMYGYDVDGEFAEFLQKYVDERLDLTAWRYQIALIDESGGRRRTGWGGFAGDSEKAEAPPPPSGPPHSYGASWESQPTYESSLPPEEPWGKDPWSDG